MQSNERIHFVTDYLMETWKDLVEYLLKNPEKLMETQFNYYQSYVNLCNEFSNNKNVAESINAVIDKRFRHEDWQKNLIFNFIQRSYLLISQHINQLSHTLGIENSKEAQKLGFYMRQLMDAVAPSNFINTNPEILSKIFETNGENLMNGFKQFQEDLKESKWQFKIKQTDLHPFGIGRNIAVTPGKIIYQNDLMQLIQYTATTENTYQYPLLIIPPWINKYYILDLQAENSFVKWLVDQGVTVFMISWVNPTSEHKSKTFSDYLHEGPLAALNVIKEMTKNNKINILGYCIGGTLLGCLLAYLAKQKNDITILTATFLTTLFDFSEPGELGAFIDEKQISMLEEYMNKVGYLDGNIMALVFSALKANDLIWAAFVNNYLKGEQPKPFDLLYWNADSTNIPALTHGFYLRNMYLENLLIKSNEIKINGLPLDLGKIDIPSYFLAALDDHIAPWKTCYKSQQYLKKAKVKFVLTQSGHVAGIINPPHKNKYGYWTHKIKPENPEQFLSEASFHKGSWWNDWLQWFQSYAGNLGEYKYIQTAIENAPGSYVKVRLTDRNTMET